MCNKVKQSSFDSSADFVSINIHFVNTFICKIIYFPFFSTSMLPQNQQFITKFFLKHLIRIQHFRIILTFKAFDYPNFSFIPFYCFVQRLIIGREFLPLYSPWIKVIFVWNMFCNCEDVYKRQVIYCAFIFNRCIIQVNLCVSGGTVCRSLPTSFKKN